MKAQKTLSDNAMDVYWQQKRGLIKNSEKAEAEKAYDNAKKVYQKIIDESK